MRNGIPELKVFGKSILLLVFTAGAFWVGGVLSVKVGEEGSFGIFFVGVGLVLLLFLASAVIKVVMDLRNGPTKLSGSITGKRIEDYEDSSTHHIQVEGREFKISKRIYEWVREGQRVEVTYWPRTETVVRVDK